MKKSATPRACFADYWTCDIFWFFRRFPKTFEDFRRFSNFSETCRNVCFCILRCFFLSRWWARKMEEGPGGLREGREGSSLPFPTPQSPLFRFSPPPSPAPLRLIRRLQSLLQSIQTLLQTINNPYYMADWFRVLWLVNSRSVSSRTDL